MRRALCQSGTFGRLDYTRRGGPDQMLAKAQRVQSLPCQEEKDLMVLVVRQQRGLEMLGSLKQKLTSIQENLKPSLGVLAMARSHQEAAQRTLSDI